jgi:hypothetical protein
VSKREMDPERIALDHLASEVVALVRDADGEEGPDWAMSSTLELELAKIVDKHHGHTAKLTIEAALTPAVIEGEEERVRVRVRDLKALIGALETEHPTPNASSASAR